MEVRRAGRAWTVPYPLGEKETNVRHGLTFLLMAAMGMGLPSPILAQDNAETLREQEMARQTEERAAPQRSPVLADGEPFRGISNSLLFVGVDDNTVSTFVIDPADNNTQPAFMGSAIWGAAVISGPMPGDAVVYFNDGASLFRWQFPDPPALCCTLMFNAATATVVSVAYDPTAGELLFTRNIATEAVYSLPVTAVACPVTCDLTQEIVYASGDNDFGGLAYDPATDTLYGTNDDGTPGPAGVYEINDNGTTALVVAYPNGETDIDGLAFADGILYLVTDQPGNIYVYNIGTASFDPPLTNPWSSSELFSGAGAGTGLVIPVELQSFTVD